MKPRPILRYHGGKWILAPWIISNMPPHRVYVEPFGGGASVLLRKGRSYGEVYNELDGEVVNLFRVVRERGGVLRQKLLDTPFAREEFELSYETSEDPMEQARRTVVRSFMGFASVGASGAKTGFRANSNRSGTIPVHDWVNFPEALQGLTDRLRGVVIECGDAAKVMLAHDGKDVLHYVDPPYVLDTRSNMSVDCKKGYRFELSDDDHRALATTLLELKGMVMLSGYPCELYAELYGAWNSVERDSLADGAQKRTEVIWFNDAAWKSKTNIQEVIGFA
jgi:DNA adenine methylase